MPVLTDTKIFHSNGQTETGAETISPTLVEIPSLQLLFFWVRIQVPNLCIINLLYIIKSCIAQLVTTSWCSPKNKSRIQILPFSTIEFKNKK
jgi:hypothetical protein